MKKKILTIILVLVMLLPTAFAVANLILSRGGAIDTNVVTNLNITDPQGKVFSFSKEEPTGIRGNSIAFFADLNGSGTEIAEIPDAIAEKAENKFIAEYVSYDKTAEYNYYFLSYDEDAYYSDSDGKAYRIDADYAKEFMRSQYCSAIFPNAAAPKLVFPSEETVTPISLDWHYLVSATVYSDDNHYETKREDRYYDLVVGMSFGFDTAPGTSKVTIKENNGGAEVYDGDFSRFTFNLLKEGVTYDFQMDAEWFETSERGSSGKASYDFSVKVISIPQYSISNLSINSPGGFLEISAYKVPEGRTITATTEPDIGITPTFIADGQLRRALLPLSPALDSIPEAFDLTVSMAGYSKTYPITVVQNATGSETKEYSSEILNGIGSQDSYNELYQTLLNVYLASPTERKFEQNLPFSHPVDINVGYIDSTYGTYRTVPDGFDRMHRGIDYVAPEGTDVVSCAPGTVVYIGQTDYSGNMIVIDHGLGLCSTYMHLSEVSQFNIGDSVEQGSVIGKVGNTGAALQTGVHFEMTIYYISVSPVAFLYNGVVLSDASFGEITG